MGQRCLGQFEQEGGFPCTRWRSLRLLDDVFFGPHADAMDNPNQESTSSSIFLWRCRQKAAIKV